MHAGNKTKAQSAFEFMATYAWAFLILALIIVGLYIFIFLPSSIVPARCGFTYAITCQGISVGTNALGTYVNLELVNGQEYDLVGNTVSGNTIATVAMGSYGTANGMCTPTNVISGGTILCYIVMPKTVPLGTNVGGTIYLNSSICLQGTPSNCQTMQKISYTGNFTSKVSSITNILGQSFIYSGAANTGSSTLTGPSGAAYSYYICAGSQGNGNGVGSSTSWNPADIQILPVGQIPVSASVGHQTSGGSPSTCTVSDIAPASNLNALGELSVGASSPTITAASFSNPSGAPMSYSVTAASSFVVIAVACGQGVCPQPTFPASCSLVPSASASGPDQDVYIAVCASQNPATYTVYVTNSGGYVAEAAYNFGPTLK